MLSIIVIGVLILLSILCWCKSMHDRINNLQDIIYRTAKLVDGNINGLTKITDVVERQQKRIEELESVLYSTQRLDRR